MNQKQLYENIMSSIAKEVKKAIDESFNDLNEGRTPKVVKPKSRAELEKIVNETIKKKGNKADLNFIDTSQILNMSRLFCNSHFNGDISKWDVCNVQDMSNMFANSPFNGDLSEWDVSSVYNMAFMFYNAKKFNQDISMWDVSSVDPARKRQMFWGCPIKEIFKPNL